MTDVVIKLCELCGHKRPTTLIAIGGNNRFKVWLCKECRDDTKNVTVKTHEGRRP